MKNFVKNMSLRGLFLRFWSIGLVLLLWSNHLFAGSVNLAWNASTSSKVAGYIVSYGQNSSNYTSDVDVGNTTQHSVSGLQEGVKYFIAVKAYDSARTTNNCYRRLENGLNWPV